jgi:carbon-monoxide dehydrogenase medium subunit
VGVSVTLNENHSHFKTVRLALAAVAPIPLYIPEVGDMLAGKEVTPQAVQETARFAQAAIRPISDLRGTAEHRRQLSAVLTRRAFEKAIERARL